MPLHLICIQVCLYMVTDWRPTTWLIPCQVQKGPAHGLCTPSSQQQAQADTISTSQAITQVLTRTIKEVIFMRVNGSSLNRSADRSMYVKYSPSISPEFKSACPWLLTGNHLLGLCHTRFIQDLHRGVVPLSGQKPQGRAARSGGL